MDLFSFMASISDAVGLVGVSLVLMAFSLLNTNKLTSMDMIYQLLNLIGSILLLYSLFYHVNAASVVIEIAWITISLIGIYRIVRSRRPVSIIHAVNDIELSVAVSK